MTVLVKRYKYCSIVHSVIRVERFVTQLFKDFPFIVITVFISTFLLDLNALLISCKIDSLLLLLLKIDSVLSCTCVFAGKKSIEVGLICELPEVEYQE